MTQAKQNETDSRRGSVEKGLRRSILIPGAIGLGLWLVLIPTAGWLLSPYTALAYFSVLGPLGSMALLTWAVKAGLITHQELEGQLVPILGAGMLLVWTIISTALSYGAWRLWKYWEFWLAILIPLLLGYFAGLLIRQGLRSLGCLSGLQWWFPHGLYLIIGSLLWAALFPLVVTFILVAPG